MLGVPIKSWGLHPGLVLVESHVSTVTSFIGALRGSGDVDPNEKTSAMTSFIP